MVANLTVNRPQRRSHCACKAQPMSFLEVPPLMESSEDEWSDEDSGSDGERQAADDDDGNYTNRWWSTIISRCGERL
jgi:hypothetical protein